eukprot:COSAG06_NODE_13029_length_1300_cov_2.255620_1_plen_45_part_00
MSVIYRHLEQNVLNLSFLQPKVAAHVLLIGGQIALDATDDLRQK